MKRVITSLQKEYDRWPQFSKEEVKECFDTLVKENFLIQVGISDQYKFNNVKAMKLLKDFEKTTKNSSRKVD